MSQNMAIPWDPKSMAMASTLGEKQALSTRPTAPAFGFGAASREALARVFLSHEHASALHASVSPGPAGAGALPSGVGKQPLSERPTAPAYMFARASRYPRGGAALTLGPGEYEGVTMGLGSKQRMSSHRTTPAYSVQKSTRETEDKRFVSADVARLKAGRHSPGPAAHDLRSPTLGKQSLSTRKTSPSFQFGSSKRFVYAHTVRSQTLPGPGAYSTPVGSSGRQIEGKRENEPRTGFGKGTRAAQEKVFISDAHSRLSTGGLHSPGPQAYGNRFGSVGRQQESTRRSAAQWAFGKADRWGPQPNPAHGVPGPGRYAT